MVKSTKVDPAVANAETAKKDPVVANAETAKKDPVVTNEPTTTGTVVPPVAPGVDPDLLNSGTDIVLTEDELAAAKEAGKDVEEAMRISKMSNEEINAEFGPTEAE
jgi:hypothetical protein